MPKPGARPKPTVLKQLHGDIHKARWNKNEPKPAVSRPTCPQHLSPSARYQWGIIVPELLKLGLLTNIDRAELAMYCQAWGDWADARKELNKLTKMSPNRMAFLYKTTNGNLVVNPLMFVANKAEERMQKYLIEFGMTPSSRTRIATDVRPESEDPIDQILNTRRDN
jgi:P27 family predicted phage terminase small subunit